MIREQARITETRTDNGTFIRLTKCIDDEVLFEKRVAPYLDARYGAWISAARRTAWQKARRLHLEVVE